MTDDTCPRHPGQPVVAVCIRFGRRYCEFDFNDPDHPVECLSSGAHCRERPYCMLWVRMKEEQRRLRQEAAEAESRSAAPPAPVEWKEILRGPLGLINVLMIFLLYDEEFRVKIKPAPGPGQEFMMLVPERDAVNASDVIDYYLTKWRPETED